MLSGVLKRTLPVSIATLSSAMTKTTAVVAANEMGTGVQLSEVLAVLEEFAPKALSADWDNTGLLVEPYTPRPITKILLTNDLTEDVALECKSLNAEMIVSYHPPIFSPLKSVVQATWKEKVVSLLLENRIALYSPHTSWDCVNGGVNEWLAASLPVATTEPIQPGATPDIGIGRLLYLQTSITLSEAIEKVKSHTGLKHLRVAVARNQTLKHSINKVAICAGAGTSVVKNVPADLYLTGEMLHHDILDATQRGISVILTNHSDSERGFLSVFAPKLEGFLSNKVDVFVSKIDKDPVTTV